MERINVIQKITESPIGTSFANWAIASDQPIEREVDDEEFTPMFLFKVDDGQSGQICDRSVMEIRSIGFKAGCVFMIVIMFRFPVIDRIYPVFINHFDGDPIGSMLKRLTKMEEVTLLFFEPCSKFNDYQPIEIITIKNIMPFSKFYAHVLEHYLDGWIYEDFEEAKSQCPPIQTMWELSE